MKQITLPTGIYLLVEVPENVYDFLLTRDEPNEPTSLSYLKNGSGNSVHVDGSDFPEMLEPEYYEIIGMADSLTDAQWMNIVSPISGWSSVLYYKYTAPGSDYRDIIESGLKSPSKSGLSLVKSHSMNPETTLVIRKNK